VSGDRRRPSGNPGRAPVRIRTAGLADAAALLDLKRRLDQETSFMMFEAGEREASVQDLARSAKAPGCCGRR
jgi:hypothetical protein